MSSSSSTDSDQENEQHLDIQNKKALLSSNHSIRTRVAIVKSKNNSRKVDLELVADIPSAVSYTDDAKCLVGLCAAHRIVSSPKHSFHATKCLIGRSYDDPVVQEFAKNVGYDILRSSDGQACVMSTRSNQILSPGQIATLIFLKLKELCQEKLKAPMENVVITYPVHFTENQIKLTRESAQLAGLNVLKMIIEPTAVILPFSVKQIDNKTFVIYDFGGTFKVSVLNVRNGEPEIKSSVHDLFLGGDNFDKVLVNYFVKKLKRMIGFDVSEDLATMQWLKTAAQNAQMDLCYSTELDVFFYCIRYQGKPKRISIKLTRSKFEKLVAEFINKTIPLCHKALEDAKVAVSDIDEVFAIGGVSKIPKVRATVQEIFNKIPEPTMGHGNRVKCVAIGAAVIGRNLSIEITDDDIAFGQVPPQFLKPVEETENFSFRISDGLYDYDNFIDELVTKVAETGILTILPEEEADLIIYTEYRSSPNRNQNGDVNYIPAYKEVIEKRRRISEYKIPDELQAYIDTYRKRKNDFVFKELCRRYR